MSLFSIRRIINLSSLSTAVKEFLKSSTELAKTGPQSKKFVFLFSSSEDQEMAASSERQVLTKQAAVYKLQETCV